MKRARVIIAVLGIASAGCMVLAGLEERHLRPDPDASSPGADVDAGCPLCTPDPQCANAADGTLCGDAGSGDGAATRCFDGRCGGRAIVSLSVYDFGCVTRAAGTVWCWGGNDRGQLGLAPDGASHHEPRKIAGLETVLEVSTGRGFGCARKADGSVLCWGKNDDGQLGHDPAQDDLSCTCNRTPKTVPLARPAIAVAAGDRHACAVTVDREVYCWGSNLEHELGDPKNDGPRSFTPVKVALPSPNAAKIWASHHTCATTVTSALICWGRGTYGQLGRDCQAADCVAPAPVKGLPGAVREAAVGENHTCAVADQSGSDIVACWGAGLFGATGRTNDDPTPIPVSGVGSASHVSSRHRHTCAVTSGSARGAGSLLCWGDRTDSALGNRDGGACLSVQGCPTPGAVGGVSAPTLVSSHATNLVLTADGGVLTWGKNVKGLLGHIPGESGDIPCGGSDRCNPAPTLHPHLP